MIANYPDRRFQLWEYRVSHGSLLIRSPKGPQSETNIDMVFVGVEYLAVPHSLRGIALHKGSSDDLAVVSISLGEVDPEHVYVLMSQGRRHPIVAVAYRIDENEADIFDSPF